MLYMTIPEDIYVPGPGNIPEIQGEREGVAFEESCKSDWLFRRGSDKVYRFLCFTMVRSRSNDCG